MKYTIIPLSLALWAAAQAALAQTADMPKPEDFKPGDQWVWRQVDNLTNLETGQRMRTVVQKGDEQKFSNGQSSSPIQAAYMGNKFKTSWRQWPLAVGKQWEYRQEKETADGSDHITTDVTVAAYEEVTVPAGKFMAFRIEYRGFHMMSRAGRGDYKGRYNETYWYAPEVMADVKIVHDAAGKQATNQWTRELMAFQRGKSGAAAQQAEGAPK